ncbi:MAG: bifunctional folylpolyglutamate synthase/dihydrofolate synthase [Prevotella sp.]|nr:bifunctional folylpolyglutamate synthase/dihydrofolate synthase [Prevotella sp.]
MNYQETCEYLFSQTPNYEKQGASGYKEGLENTMALDEHFGHPHEHFRSIHIGGTNGKGSVAHLIAAHLQVCGYRVGLYTSPHLVDFRERIRVNGSPISESYVVKFVETEKDFFEPLNPSFFELATAMAFKYFKEMDVDIAVVEVGLGGRLDCTNIITPILSIITNVSLDHTQLLGNSAAQIAMEKAGIIKRGVPVIIGKATPETRPVFEAKAQESDAPIVFAEDEPEIISSTPTAKGIHYKTKHHLEFDCELAGEYQPQNVNTVLTSFVLLKERGYLCDSTMAEDYAAVINELNNTFMNVTKITGLKGRWQTVQTNPTVVCDTGHNQGAWQHISLQLGQVNCRQMRIVFGMMKDKDIYSVMELLPKQAVYYFTKASTNRALPETSLKIFGEQMGLQGNSYPTVEKAFKAALEESHPDDFIFVGGSTYVVADFMKTRI